MVWPTRLPAQVTVFQGDLGQSASPAHLASRFDDLVFVRGRGRARAREEVCAVEGSELREFWGEHGRESGLVRARLAEGASRCFQLRAGPSLRVES